MILTLSLAMLLWQGTFAQPQLDGRYGVDRVAMEKQAKEAQKCVPLPKNFGINLLDLDGHDTCYWIEWNRAVANDGYTTQFPAWYFGPMPIKECHARGGKMGSEYCRPEVPEFAQSNAKPSSHLTAVRAVPSKDYLGRYDCPDKSDILLHSEDGSKHWCLKIEDPAATAPSGN